MRWKLMFAVMLLVVAGVVQAADAAPFSPKMATAETIKQLRAGGFVLYMRHGPTDTSRPDRVPRVDLNDCSTQRPLTEVGRLVAKQVGEAIRRAGIPIGVVESSPMCRCKGTAEAAFGKGYVVNANLMYTSNLTSEEKVPRIANTRRLLSTPVPAGTNRVIVAHAPNLMDVIGYFPKPEALVVVFRPQGERGFEYIASIPPDQWSELVP